MSDAQLKIVDGPDSGREFPVGGVLVIGRDPSAGIVLDDAEVSRRHAQVSPRSSGMAVEDLGSTNGTFVDGEQIEGERLLLGGEKVRVGTTVFEVSVPIQATKVASAIPDVPPAGATKVASSIPDGPGPSGSPGTPPPGADDDEETVVPDDEPAGATADTDAPAPGPPTSEQPAPPTPAPQSPGPQSPQSPGPQSPQSPGFQPPPPSPGSPPPPPVQSPSPPPPPPSPGAAPAPLPQPTGAQPPAGTQAGPGFQVRGPGEQWALCALVPFYNLIWYHRLCKEIGEWSQGRIHTSPGTSLVAVTLGAFILVPPFVSFAGTMGRIRQCQQMAGLQPQASFWGFIGRSLLFGYGYKWLTEQLNELAVRRPVQ